MPVMNWRASTAWRFSWALVMIATCDLACSARDSAPKDASRAGSVTFANDGGVVLGAGNPNLEAGTIINDGSQVAITNLTIETSNPVLNVVNGTPAELDFKAKRNGVDAAPVWSISRAEIGTIDPTTGHFVTGTLGGQATIIADAGGVQASTTITVIFVTEDNGAGTSSTCAAGGCGGVGGEGGGPALGADMKQALDGSATPSAALTWLYPYDATVWPLGLLAPLLQWSFDQATTTDAIKLELKSAYYSYTGYFGRPQLLAAGAAFARHPIPQAAWDGVTGSSPGSSVRVFLSVLAGGQVYGPMKETWKIATTPLKGTVYYQSYGTKLAHNLPQEHAMGGGTFGGATLAIRGGSTTPTLVAGGDGDKGQCRVCHTISADGSRMIVQHGDNYAASSSYALNQPAYPETPYPTAGLLGWLGLYPDGSIGLSNAGPVSSNVNNVPSTLVDAVTGVPIASQGLSSFVTRAAMPMFSPDGKKVAFSFYAGPGDAAIGGGDPSKLVVMDFDLATSAFANQSLVYQGLARVLPGWPAFMPTGDRLVFQTDLPTGNQSEYFVTRNGARGELWYTDLQGGQAHKLERANGTEGGVSYLPVGPNNHSADNELNYEPTVSPIVSGGYAWMVFTSRRMYGNVATIDPTWSDPRRHDLTQTPTTKKLWVAAIDITASGELTSNDIDPSHPAFYLPAQELLAGNSRGYWVPDPCQADGHGCESGDQCCSGYCARDAKLKQDVCGGKPASCAQEFDRCTTSADCCAATPKLVCINAHCSTVTPG